MTSKIWKLCIISASMIVLAGCNAVKEQDTESIQETVSQVAEQETVANVQTPSPEEIMAEKVKEKKEEWYQIREYPILPGTEEWAEFSFIERIDILNPPEDLLKEMPSSELAELMYSYPFDVACLSFDETFMFFVFWEKYCEVFNEIGRREDGVPALLELYRDNEITDEDRNNDSASIWCVSPAVRYDFFVCLYMDYYKDNLKQEDIDTFIAIFYGEKKAYTDFLNSPWLFRTPTWDEEGNIIRYPRNAVSQSSSEPMNGNDFDKEIPEKHQVNRQELEITYESQDGIDPMRAMHRSISVGGNIYLTYNEEDGYYIPIGETGQLPLGLENSKGLHVCNVTADVYGRLSFLMSNEDYNKWYIWQLDEENQVKNEIDISEYCKTKYIPNWFLVDKDGYYYLQWPMDRTGMVLDNGGVMLHRTSPQSLGVDWIYEAAVGKSGNIYILYGDEIQGKQFGKLELMNASLQMTKSELVLPEDEVITLAGAGTDTELLLFSPYSGIWAYDDENEILENRVPLSEITNGQNKEYLPLVFLEDGRLVMLAQVDNSDTEKEAEFSMRYIPAGK